MRNFTWVIIVLSVLLPSLGYADVASLAQIQTSITGSYPEATLGAHDKLGLDVSITYGPLGWKNEKFRASVGADRKLAVPDLSKVATTDQKDLLPINVEFSVPSPDVSMSGISYLRDFVFLSVEEYQSFFSSPLAVSFFYPSSAYRAPMTFALSTKDGSLFAKWYAANVITNAKANCLFVGIQFLTPQATRGYNALDLGDEIGQSGARTSGATFLILKADQPATYKLTVFSSTNPYICDGGSGASPTESASNILMTEVRTADPRTFPNQISVVVP